MQEGRFIQGADPVSKGAGCVKLIEISALGDEGDSDRGVCDCMNENGLANVTEFGLFGAKKFTARRYVKKEVTYFDLRSDGQRTSSQVRILPPSTRMRVPSS